MQYKTLVIGSSFYNEFNLLGSLLALDEIYNLKNIKTYVSNSTSCIVSLLMSLEIPIYEIASFFNKNSIFYKNEDIISNNIENRFQLLKIKTMLEEFIINKIKLIPKMYQLYTITGKKLYFMIQDQDENLDFFSYDSTPDMNCVDALLYSINSKNIYEIPNSILPGNFYDSSILNPFPLDFIEDIESAIGLFTKFEIESNDQKENLIVKLLNSRTKDISNRNTKHKIYNLNVKIYGFNDNIQNLIDGYFSFEEFMYQL